jgi:hypothetical protein
MALVSNDGFSKPIIAFKLRNRRRESGFETEQRMGVEVLIKESYAYIVYIYRYYK